jgi:hypothetical protein
MAHFQFNTVLEMDLFKKINTPWSGCNKQKRYVAFALPKSKIDCSDLGQPGELWFDTICHANQNLLLD